MSTLLELDAEDLDTLAQFATEQQQNDAWSNATELAARQTELLEAILQRLMGGIGIRFVKKLAKQPDPSPVTRPPWVKPPEPTEQVMSPGEFFAAMRNK